MKTLTVNISDIIFNISNKINELVVKLSPYEQKIFVTKYGVEIGKFQRKAGKEYCDVVDNLSLANKLENLQGKFLRLVFQDEKFAHIEYVESQTLAKKTFTEPVKFVINCCGFEHLTINSSSDLILSLIINKFYFLSCDGTFPYRCNNGQVNLDHYTLVSLDSLKNSSKITSKQILESVKKDV